MIEYNGCNQLMLVILYGILFLKVEMGLVLVTEQCIHNTAHTALPTSNNWV